ncbi:MAG: hypothetical protein LBQ19_01225 [Synergistaceae bacterium]|nr:hypothetical protein [Synergistaceae bacterium]
MFGFLMPHSLREKTERFNQFLHLAKAGIHIAVAIFASYHHVVFGTVCVIAD